MSELILFSKGGCCICKGLEDKLVKINLRKLSIELKIIDIDISDIPIELKERYKLNVPVLVLSGHELPRVSPRLNSQGLLNWLEQALVRIRNIN